MSVAVDKAKQPDHLIDSIENQGGPCLVVFGAMHGNEPAGVQAIQNVFNQLREKQLQIHGSFFGLIGNKAAYQKQKRYIDKDLNRIWDFDLHRMNGKEVHELNERQEIYKFLRGRAEKTSQLYVMDLHTTSSSSSPFFILGDTIRNRTFAAELPVPKVLGVEELIEGTMSAYLNRRGVVAINFEAGNHVDPKSVERHEAAIWITLETSGCLTPGQVPDYERKKRTLRKSARRLPMVLESVFRYGIAENERYVMKPGYYNFRRVKKGEHLAYSNGSPIFAPFTGRIFMPLYQEQGQDGFFIIKRIAPFWLALSQKLRKMGPEKWLGRLPGVERHPSDANTMVVKKKIARLYPLQVFHLFGYRKFEDKGDELWVTKREYDLKAPGQINL